MGNLQDASINVKPETTFKTPVTPDRAFEFTDSSVVWTPTIVQGQGLRAGSFMPRSLRRVIVAGQGGGDLTMELMSKGFGYWLQACLGANASTLVSGSTFQQNATWSKLPSSLTVQETVPRVDGTLDSITYAGVMVSSFVITFNNVGLVTLQVTLDAADFSTATGFATLTYASTPNLFHFGNWSLATGTFTAPTTTALASAVTPLLGVRSLTITGNRNIVNDRFNAIGTGRKDVQIGTQFDVTGSMVVEYNATTLRDAFLNQTAMSLVSTVTAGALSSGNETFQVAIPELKIDPGDGVPSPNGTGLITQTLPFTVLDNQVAAQPIWVVMRTADAAV